MHDIDRIMNEEFNQEYGFLNEGEGEYEYEGEYEGEYEYEGEGEGEWEWEGEYEGEYEYEGEGEWEGEYEEELLNEQLEYELAAELLTVSNEQELDQFLGKLVRGVGRGLSRFAKSGIGRKLIGGLKSVAKVGLPILGKAAGTFFGGPVGGMLGGKLGSMATKLFEIQAEGMSNEDLEFEMARRFVRLARASTRNTVKNVKKGGSPKGIVTKSIKQAAVKHAPGLLKPGGISQTIGTNKMMTSGSIGGGYSGGGGGDMAGTQSSGTWSRQGNKIVLYGV